MSASSPIAVLFDPLVLAFKTSSPIATFSSPLDKLGIPSSAAPSLKEYKDRLPAKLIDQISSNPRVVTTGYKMTDGRSIGITVKLENGEENWFFPEEIEKG